jgi:hypothetical protein
MIWLTWRQFRAQAIAVAALLVLLAIVLTLTGLGLAHQYAMSGLTTCHAQHDCASAANDFLARVQAGWYATIHKIGLAVVVIMPALAGMFWGAPLVAREMETGTFRLAWNQSVTSRRWITVKLGLVGLVAMVTAGLLGLALSWWVEPVYRAAALAGGGSELNASRFGPVNFDTQGIVPIAYAAFAFALGVAAGVAMRRTIPAMAATLGVFGVVQFAWPSWIRPHLMSPAHAIVSIPSVTLNMLGSGNGGDLYLAAGGRGSDWILASHAVNAAGRAVTRVPSACQSAFNGGPAAFPRCLSEHGIRIAMTYQPASRFWDFQWLEAGVFVAVAAALAGFCFWRVARRQIA